MSHLGKRVKNEVIAIQKLPYITAISNDSENEIKYSMKGPAGSPFEGGIFKIRIDLGESPIFNPPTFIMETTIFHPNIGNQEPLLNKFCPDLLGTKSEVWTQRNKLIDIVTKIYDLFKGEPNVGSVVNEEAMALYHHEKNQWIQKCKELTKQYAK